MKFAKKEFSDYWKIIKIPTYIMIAWSILGFILSIVSFSLYSMIFSAMAGWILVIAVFGFIGWTAVKDHNEGVKIAAWSGALSGVIAGFIGAVIAILMFYIAPDVILQQAASTGVDISQLQSFMQIGLFIGLVTGPLLNGIIGAIISSIAGFIGKKV